MDPRSQRSRDRLTSAVFAFASNGRLDDVTVSELSRTAGVTRDTFYRHASSVTELLTAGLSEKLDDLVSGYDDGLPSRTELAAALRAGELHLLEHIAELGTVYRTALSGQNAAPVRRTLTTFLRSNLEVAIRAYPDIAPLTSECLDDRAIGIIASYAASGTVGAIESWLETGDFTDIEGVGRIIKSGAPEWWINATAESER